MEEQRAGTTGGTAGWQDDEDDLSFAIAASHPMKTGRHDIYERAMELVGNRKSKGALVALVNYLLAEIAKAGAEGYDSVMQITELEAAFREWPCPRPCNGRPDDFTVGQCVDAWECGCTAGVVLGKPAGAQDAGVSIEPTPSTGDIVG